MSKVHPSAAGDANNNDFEPEADGPQEQLPDRPTARKDSIKDTKERSAINDDPHDPAKKTQDESSGGAADAAPKKSSSCTMVVAVMIFILIAAAVTVGVLFGTGSVGNNNSNTSPAAGSSSNSGSASGGDATDGGTTPNGGTPTPGAAGDPTFEEVILDEVERPLPSIAKGKLSLAVTPKDRRVLARGYDGNEWEAVPNSRFAPALIVCQSAQVCYLRGQPFEIENITVPAEFATPSAELFAARLLSQGAFGASLAEVKRVATTYGTDVSKWVQDQIALPKTLSRVYFRERINPRMMKNAYNPLPETDPCMVSTRWQEYALETRDVGLDLVVSKDNANKKFVWTIGGTVRTMTDMFNGENFPGNLTLPKTYEIEEVRDGINGTVELKGLDDDEKNPKISFTSAAATALGKSLQVLGETEASWSNIVGGLAGSRIMSWRGPACTIEADANGNAFVRYGPSLYLRFDKRIQMWTNTFEQPSYVGSGPKPGECPIAPRRFGNRDHCVRSTACGVNVTLTKGVEVTLDEATLKVWGSDTVDPRYVYRMDGLRLESEYAVSFCSSVFSRWLKVASCTPTTFGSTATLTAVQNALTASADTNPYIRDVSITTVGCDSNDAKTIGAFVQAGGSCWQHVHPDLYSVHDATQWAVEHDGNRQVTSGGGANPITKHAAAGRVNLPFPASHTMFRWTNRKTNLPYVGRFGDSLSFGSLETSLQTNKMATHLNATISTAGDAAITCGSENEVTNDPTKGHHYSWYQYADSNPRQTDSNYDTRRQHQRVLQNMAFKSDDQLRQRVAWALSNLVVIGQSIDYSEGMLKWYDIFIKNAFGNFQDMLTEVTWNTRMVHWLTYHGSRSTESRGGQGLPDENYAREIMQLFSIGLWKLNDDGSQKVDSNRNSINTYSADDIMDFARVFTGLNQPPPRVNLVDRRATDRYTYVDAPNVIEDRHDMLPKAKLDEGHIGDYMPICEDMGPRPWLQAGARYEYTGSKSFEGPDIDDAPDDAPLNHRTRFTPAQDGSSALYKALCAAPSAGARCEFPMIVTLPSTLACAGDQECNAERIITVAIVDPVAKETKFYRFIDPPCVRLTFFEGGMQVRGRSSACSPPEIPRGHPSCCNITQDKRLRTQIGVQCRFANEMMSYPKAKALCEANGLQVCDRPTPSFNTSCGNVTYLWTDNPCQLKIQVYGKDRISMYDPTYKARKFGYNSFSFFRARWNDEKAPAPATTDGACPSDSPCSTIATGDAFSCVCNFTVNETMPYASVNSFTVNTTVDDVARTLFIGAVEPSRYGGYTLCNAAACTALAARNIKVWLNTGDSESAFTMRTIIEIPSYRAGGVTRYLFNRLSTVHIGAYSFRNMPNYMPNAGFSRHQTSTHGEQPKWWDRKLELEINALVQHLAEHQNTAVFVATHMIKHLVTSNPSPRYIKAAATAFRAGAAGGVTFSGKYGDLGAMVHAILTDQEARSTALIVEPSAGMMVDPVVKVISALRGLEYKSRSGRELVVDLSSTGMNFLTSSTVFGFFDPFYQPSGNLTDSGLFAPQAELLSSPNVVSMLNGFHSLIDNGLMDCDDGFGTRLEGARCDWRNRDRNRDEYADGKANMKPTAADAATVLSELSLALTAGRLTRSSYTWTTLVKEYDAKVTEEDADAALRHVAKLILSSPEFHTSGTNRPTQTPRPAPPPSSSQGRRLKTIIFVNLAGGADTASFLVPMEECKDEYDRTIDMYEHYKSVRTLSTYDKSLLDKIDAQGSNQACRYYGMHNSMSALKKLYDEGDLLWFANVGGLVEPLTNETYKSVQKQKPKFLYAHNFMQGAMQKVDGLQADVYGILGRATDELSSRGTSPYDIWLNDFSSGNSVLTAKNNRKFSIRGNTNLLRQRNALTGILKNMTANVSESMMADNFAGEMIQGIESANVLDVLLRGVEEPAAWGSGGFAADMRRASHAIRAAANASKERAGLYARNGGWDTHGDSDLGEDMGEISDGLDGLVKQLKADGRWDDTVIVVTSEFGRTGTNNGAGTDHGWGGNNFILGGAVKGGRIVGDYPRQLLRGEWVVGRRSVWLPSTPWEGMWKGILEWYGLTNDEIHRVLPHLKNFPANRVFDKNEIFN